MFGVSGGAAAGCLFRGCANVAADMGDGAAAADLQPQVRVRS
jgi:hypothetical protein